MFSVKLAERALLDYRSSEGLSSMYTNLEGSIKPEGGREATLHLLQHRLQEFGDGRSKLSRVIPSSNMDEPAMTAKNPRKKMRRTAMRTAKVASAQRAASKSKVIPLLPRATPASAARTAPA